MKKIAMCVLALLANVTFAQEVTKPAQIDWAAIKGKAVVVDADDALVKAALEKRFTNAGQGSLRLHTESFYSVMAEEAGFPFQHLPVVDAIAGKEPDRTKFKYVACGKPVAPAPVVSDQAASNENRKNYQVGSMAGQTVAAGAGAGFGASQGVGQTVGLAVVLASNVAKAISTAGENKVRSCDEFVTVCPAFSSMCSWKEGVVTNVTLYDGDNVIAETSIRTLQAGRGMHPKELAEKHLNELQGL